MALCKHGGRVRRVLVIGSGCAAALILRIAAGTGPAAARRLPFKFISTS